MSIPDEYRPLTDKLLDRLDKGIAKWEESATLGEVFQVVQGHSFLINRSDLPDGQPRILVKILGPKGQYLYSDTVQQSDPDFTSLELLYNTGTQQVEAAAGGSTV
jgi:hypothetical protein